MICTPSVKLTVALLSMLVILLKTEIEAIEADPERKLLPLAYTDLSKLFSAFTFIS